MVLNEKVENNLQEFELNVPELKFLKIRIENSEAADINGHAFISKSQLKQQYENSPTESKVARVRRRKIIHGFLNKRYGLGSKV